MPDTLTQIPKRKFGNLDLQGSVIGLGTVKWGRNQKVRYAPFDLPTDRTVEHLLETAESLGINVIDTAPAYGLSEERVGKALQSRKGRFIVVTKAGEEFVDGHSEYDFSKEAITKSVIRSLKRLEIDTIDILLLHAPPNDVEIFRNSSAIPTVLKLKESGLIRYIGCSTMTLEGGLLAAEISDVLMVAWNIGYKDHQPVIQKAARLGKAVLLKKALMPKPIKQSIDASHTPSVSECIQAALALPEVSCLIAGTISPDHLRQNVLASLPK